MAFIKTGSVPAVPVDRESHLIRSSVFDSMSESHATMPSPANDGLDDFAAPLEAVRPLVMPVIATHFF